jgi:hypothetical protein
MVLMMTLIATTNSQTLLKHEGIRVGEIIAYRAWRVIEGNWFRKGDDLLHSVFMRDYVWYPERPASGDVKTHGIYSFRDLVRCRNDYDYTQGRLTDPDLILSHHPARATARIRALADAWL